MTWLWIVLYLILGIVVARWFTARSSPISRTDAFALVVVVAGVTEGVKDGMRLFNFALNGAVFLFLSLRAGVNALGGLAGGKD